MVKIYACNQDLLARKLTFFLIFSKETYVVGEVLLMSTHNICLFVFVLRFLRPSQPNGVMSSTVSLPNHTFTGQV